MAINQIPSLRTWVDGQAFSARDYVYERNLVVTKVNELVVQVNVLTTALDTDLADGANFLDARYYTESELNNGQLDNRYYTETELDNGQLNNLYYTETEINGLFVTEQNRLSRLESKFDATILAENDQLFDQAVNTDSEVEFTSVTLGANTVNEAFIDGLEDKYTVANADSTFIKQNQLGVANGVATLDAGGTLTPSQLPLNVVVFKGTFGDGVGDLPSTGAITGDFYICVSNGYVSAVAGQTFDTGDKAVYDGTNWSKIDNTESVTSVNGAIGAVVLDFEDVGAAPLVHTHVETDITDLDKYTQSEVNQLLGGKSDTGHTHLEADITDLDKYTEAEVDTLLAGKANTVHTHVEADITDLDKYTQTEVDNALALKLNTSLKGAVNGLAELDANGHVPANQLPSFVDDVLEYADFASFPATGQTGKIYVAQDTGLVYRWGVTMYIEIAANEVNSVNGEVGVVVLDAGDIGVSAAAFDGVLNTDDTDIQTALTTLDGHTHDYADITAKPDFYTEAEMDALLSEKANVADLSSSITLYPTTTPSAVSGYFTMVTDITDERYNDTAFNVGTGAITSQDQLIASLATDVSLFTGNPGVINVTTIGNIRKTAGNTNAFAEFFYRIFQRKANGTETQIGISETTGAVNPETLDVYFEFSAAAILNNGTFETTDRVVIKYYANAMEGTTSQYDFQFGGATPVRTLLPVPVRVLQSAERIVYDNSTSSLAATNLQTAVDELDQLIQENTTVIQIQKFNIIAADNGSGGFTYTYTDGPASVTGTKSNGAFVFPLRDNVVYIPNNNRVEAKVNNDITFYFKDSELIEVDQATLAIDYALQNGDEVFFKIYQGLDSVALIVSNGSITTAKLSTALQNDLISYDNHIASTANPHGVTKSQVGLANVTNDAQVKKAASSTDGFITKWSGTTGDAIVDGYGVQTTLASSTTELVRADAIATAIGTKQDTLISGTNIKTINGSTILGSGNYEIDIPSVDIASTPPSTPNVGDLWWNDTNGVLYIYYNDGTSSQWVEVGYADVDAAINALIADAPGALDTLNELAAALGDDPNFATTITNAIALKANQTDLDTLTTTVNTKANALASFVALSANRTLELTDGGKVLTFTNTDPVTITVPANATIEFPVGTQIAVLRNGTGTVTFAGASGVTVNSKDSALAIAGQYASAALLKTATDTWQLIGSLE
jgi:hypothetical protein